jgi:hypothetical protein
LIQDEKEQKDLTKYLAGNSPTKGAARSRGPKSPTRGYDQSAATFK